MMGKCTVSISLEAYLYLHYNSCLNPYRTLEWI
jgi:hypothetical protein